MAIARGTVRRSIALITLGWFVLFPIALPATRVRAAETQRPAAEIASYYYHWHQSQEAPVEMIPASDGVCMLQVMQGKFLGRGEAVWVRINAETGRWELGGESKQKHLFAAARCVEFAAFQLPPGSTLRINTITDVVARKSDRYGKRAELGDRSNFCVINGMSGKMGGAGERAWLALASIDRTTSRTELQVSTNQRELWSTSTCLVIDGVALPRSTITDAWFNGTPSRFNVRQGQPAARMPSSTDALCGLTNIAGKFYGAGENVGISRDSDDTQYLYAMSKQKGVEVGATCLYFDQRQLVTPPASPAPAGPAAPIPGGSSPSTPGGSAPGGSASGVSVEPGFFIGSAEWSQEPLTTAGDRTVRHSARGITFSGPSGEVFLEGSNLYYMVVGSANHVAVLRINSLSNQNDYTISVVNFATSPPSIQSVVYLSAPRTVFPPGLLHSQGNGAALIVVAPQGGRTLISGAFRSDTGALLCPAVGTVELTGDVAAEAVGKQIIIRYTTAAGRNDIGCTVP